MTLRELFDYLNANPLTVVGYFLLILITAFLAGMMGRGEGHQSPWKYLYAAIVYLVCVPGIFAAALAVYLFLFENGGSIYNLNLLTQVLPIGAMLVTLGVVRRNVEFGYIPGFGKLTDLIMTIVTVFVLMYFLNRLHLVAWVYVPVQWLLLIVAALLLIVRFGLKRLSS
ncbi:MAG TPA: hypothetical protein VK168_20840 [Saprospiraceae bacterium]|nr:hypothetical protein [Saprospiraceae bacterium]